MLHSCGLVCTNVVRFFFIRILARTNVLFFGANFFSYSFYSLSYLHLFLIALDLVTELVLTATVCALLALEALIGLTCLPCARRSRQL